MRQKPVFGSSAGDELVVQRRIGLVFSVIGAGIALYNVILGYYQGLSTPVIFRDASVWLVAMLSLAFYLISSIDHWLVRVAQILFVLIVSTISIMYDYTDFFGLGLFVLAVLMTFRYRFFERRGIVLMTALLVYVLVIVEVSVAVSGVSGVGLDVILYFGLFFTIIYIIYQSEINRILFSEKRLRTNIQTLIKERNDLKVEIGEKQERLEYLEETIRKSREDGEIFDLEACGLTPKEMDVVEVLVRYRASNKVISEKMKIKESTVKLHLYHIFNKCGVDDRFQLIELCRNNFI